MAQSYFIWKNIDCRSMGIYLSGPAPIVRPEERVNHIQIPGRSGDLTQIEGENIFNSYIQTVTIHVKGGFRVRSVYDWLRGADYVTFSGEPDRKQPARIIGAVTLNKHSRNIDTWVGEVQFYCQPLKENLREEKVTVTTNGSTVRNNGDVIARPMYKVTSSGTSIGLAVAGDGVPAVNAMTVSDLVSAAVIWIDAETMTVWNADRSATITEKSSGEFPVMGIGNNTVSFSNVSSVEIEKRERYL